MSAPLRIQYIGAAWCAPCKAAKPAIQELCRKYGIQDHLQILDYDMDLEDAERDTVRKLPTVRIFTSEDSHKPVLEITTSHVDQLDAWLSVHVRVYTDADF